MRERAPDPSFDAALEASLRRAFPVPDLPSARIEELLRPGPPTAEKEAVPSWIPVTIVALAAAILVLVSLRGPSPAPLETPVAVTPAEEVASIREPDLASLYYEISTVREDPFLCPSPEGLAGELAAHYDCCDELRVHPHVADLLEGPFDSTQWPGGTILTGRAGDATAVLIADLDSTYNCCVRPQLPEGSELEVFTMRLGDLVLTEITPLSEPRLFDYFTWGDEPH